MRILAALAFALVPTAVFASEPSCGERPVPQVEVVTPVMEVAMASVTDVAAYAPLRRNMESSLGPGWTINGLTVVRPLVRTQLYTADARKDEGACVWVSKAVVSFGFFDPAHVYISNKYAPGTCEYETIRNHENQHVGIHLNTRLKHVPLMKAKVEKALAEAGPAWGRDETEALAKIQAVMSEAVDEGIREFQRETGALNARIDSTSSYLDLQSRCQNW